jgi:crotonobetainyl-CoA:carnitine CoA-transferase CaiB-like acyl-CoA transferase
MPSTPIEMESVGTVPTVPAPGVGTHTESILKNLGYSEEDIQKFTADGAVRTAK